MDISLDPRLEKDSHLLGYFDSSALLLMRNALFPWFVLVPQSSEIEFYKLGPAIQTKLLDQINLVSHFIVDNYSIDKINLGSIGNVVLQLHVHIVGRSQTDVCWPGVVWGVKQFKPYKPGQVKEITQKLVESFPGAFRAHVDNA